MTIPEYRAIEWATEGAFSPRKPYTFLGVEKPRIWNDKPLRMFQVLLDDCSYTAVHLFTPKHFFDVLLKNHRRWWECPIVGFQVWY